MVEVAVSTLEGHGFGYVYFFMSKMDHNGIPKLRSDAGQKLVNYNFDLTTLSRVRIIFDREYDSRGPRNLFD